MRKYIDILFQYFGYVPAHTKVKVVRVPEIEYIVRDTEYDKYILRSQVIFSEEMAEAIGPKFKRVVEDELVKRMLDQIRENIAISQVPVDRRCPEKHYRATLLILKPQLKSYVTY